jgi:hypothetical protein
VSKNRSGGIGFLGGLTLLFIGLKLANVIDWSWLWVLSPIWIPFVFIVLLGAVVVVSEECEKRSSR